MKPGGEVLTEESDIIGELECEMQSREFFAHIGMLIMEGRMPQHSEKGRVEGPHCPSLFSCVSHVCDPSMDSSCQEVLERKEKMTLLWQNGAPMVITVLIRTQSRDLILLERWTVEAVDGVNTQTSCGGSVLLQAIRSHIHFSQLSAWLSRSRGSIPSQVIYRVCDPGESLSSDSFFQEPENHVFPLASLESDRVLRVRVESLPRCDIFSFTDEILASKLYLLKASHKSSDHEEDKELPDCTFDTSDDLFKSPLKKKTCFKKLDTQKLQMCKENNLTNRQKKIPMFSMELSKPSTSKTLIEQATSKTLIEQVLLKNCDKQFPVSRITSQDNFRTKLLKVRSLSAGKVEEVRRQGHCNQYSKTKLQPSCNLESKQPTVKQKKIIEKPHQTCSSSVEIPGSLPRCRQSLLARHVGPGTIPVFNSRTGLPVSSSPAPLRRSTTDLDIEDDGRETTNGFSGSSRSGELTALISRSAPASTTQSLLGNFEESVLNGRMEPLGTVEGFTAELGASGSFCPAHVMLPVKAHFFSLSEDNAPSPYLGYINLEEADVISAKGYHVPTKGTVQLTLFNPNKTVVKMFVVIYDFSDMPPKAQTFLRQRTFSVWRDSCQSFEVQSSLHYLIHVRFASSKSGRLYLHTDIRVIFARHPPDLPSGVKLCTVTDGPTEPRYTVKHELV